MAIHSRKVSLQSNRITADGNIGATDLQWTDPATGNTFQGQVSRIERVVNYTGANVTVAGITFAPGVWDLSTTGGIDIGAVTTVAISGGLVTVSGSGGSML